MKFVAPYPVPLWHLVVGRYRIVQQDDSRKIWIGRRDKGREGEGGVFKMRDLEKVIDKFYRENL